MAELSALDRGMGLFIPLCSIQTSADLLFDELPDNTYPCLLVSKIIQEAQKMQNQIIDLNREVAQLEARRNLNEH